jgi:hypothetical protein
MSRGRISNASPDILLVGGSLSNQSIDLKLQWNDYKEYNYNDQNTRHSCKPSIIPAAKLYTAGQGHANRLAKLVPSSSSVTQPKSLEQFAKIYLKNQSILLTTRPVK